MPMMHWSTQVQTVRPMGGFPRLLMVAEESQRSARYRLEGRRRPGAAHVIFQYTSAGCGVFADENGNHDVGPGKGFLCRSNDPATSYFFPSEGDAPWRFLFANLAGRPALEMADNLIRRYGGVYQLDPDSPCLCHLRRYHDFRQGFCQVSAAESAKAACDLLLALVQTRESLPAQDAGHALVRDAVAFIRANRRRKLTVSEVARRVNVSREHLTRTFRAETGLTPYQHIRRQRYELACRLLKETDLSCKEIAAYIGDCSASHFSAAFHLMTGMSPRRFREEGVVPAFF